MRMIGTLLLAILVVGCGRKPVSYQTDIQPILNQRCISCHRPDTPSKRVVLTCYDSLMNAKVGRWKKPVIVAGDPSNSWIYLRAGTKQLHYQMPPDTSKISPLTEEEVRLLGKWIMEGAKNN